MADTVSGQISKASFSSRSSTNSRWILAALIGIVAIGTALRLAGIDFGLPFVVGEDEGFEIHRALRLGAGEFDFSRTTKGGFFYILFVEYGLYYAWLWLTGSVGSPAEFATRFVLDPGPFWMIGRLANALLSVLVIIWTYIIGQRVYGPLPALLAAGFVAASFLDVVQAHFVSVDVLMTLLVLITVDLAIRWSDPSQRAHVLLLGIAFGCAVSTKAPAIFVSFSIFLANWLRYRREDWSKRVFGRQVVTSYFVALATLIVTNPGLALWIAQGRKNALSNLSRDIVIHEGSGANLWLFYLDAAIQSYGLPAVMLAIAGAAIAALRLRGAEVLILAFGLPYLVVICSFDTSHLYYHRYLLPLVPCAGLMISRVAIDASAMIRRPAIRAAAVAALVAVTVLPTSVKSINQVLRYLGGDTREITADWIEKHVPDGTAIFLIGNPMIRQALSVPLNDLLENQLRIAAQLRANEAALKAQVVETAAAAIRPPSYHLHAVMHAQPNLTLEEYTALGVEYFILTSNHFDPDVVATDTRRAARTLESRSSLRRELQRHGELAFAIHPRDGNYTGPGIEVYRVVSSEASDRRKR